MYLDYTVTIPEAKGKITFRCELPEKVALNVNLTPVRPSSLD